MEFEAKHMQYQALYQIGLSLYVGVVYYGGWSFRADDFLAGLVVAPLLMIISIIHCQLWIGQYRKFKQHVTAQL